MRGLGDITDDKCMFVKLVSKKKKMLSPRTPQKIIGLVPVLYFMPLHLNFKGLTFCRLMQHNEYKRKNKYVN